MSVLTEEAEKTLADIVGSRSPVFARKLVLKVVAFVRTLAAQVEADRLLSTAFFLSATGHITPEDILQRANLPEQAKVDCLQLTQNYRDAQRWREGQGTGKLKRYQAFDTSGYDNAGGSGDTVAEGETLEELAANLIAADRASFDQLLDLQGREWLEPSAELLAEIRAAYDEKHPQKPPTQLEKDMLDMLMMGESTPGPQVYHNGEYGPLTRGLNPTT